MKYFTIKELTKSTTAKNKGIDNTPGPLIIKNLEALVDNILDPLREAWGQPIIVTSGYRCPTLNKAVGGKPTSQHTTGEAVDIRTVSDTREDNKALYELIKLLKLPVDQCINEYDYDWIHVSFSPRNRRSFFSIG